MRISLSSESESQIENHDQCDSENKNLTKIEVKFHNRILFIEK